VTDQPYGLDLFHKITDIHFGGGQWFGVCGPRAPLVGSSDTLSFTIDFPDQAAGTPGFIPVTSETSHGVTFAPYVVRVSGGYTVKKSDLTHTVRTNAGSLITTFALGGVDSSNAVLMLFRMDKFPKSPFRVRLRTPGLTAGKLQNIAVFTVTKNTMKAGLHFVNSFDIPQASQIYEDVLSAGPFDFTISPTTLAVTGG
jgi:hypothetical protein